MENMNVKYVDRKMLKPMKPEEWWASMNKGGKEFQDKVENFFKVEWENMNRSGRNFQDRVEKFVQDVSLGIKLMDVSKTDGLRRSSLDRLHRFNLLGVSYKKLTKKYVPGPMLGEGGFGKVYEVTEKATGTVFACKEIDKVQLFKDGFHDMARDEVVILEHLSKSPGSEGFIMGLHEAIEDQKHLYLIMELCKGGDVIGSVAKHFSEKGSYSEADAAALMRAMFQAVQYCHRHGVIHRDIKPDNFLWTDHGATGKLKLADFGLACMWEPEGEPLKGRCGTPPYMSPEIWRDEKYTTSPDVWALGVLMVVILTGKYPFNFTNHKECAMAVCTEHIDFQRMPWTMLSADACDLISRLLAKDPNRRISIDKALMHPWIREGGTAPTSSVTSNVRNGITKMMQMNQLHKAALKLLAKASKETEEYNAILTGFNRLLEMDEHHESEISLQTLKQAVRSHLMPNLTDDDFNVLFEKIDMDGDGLISFDDFAALSIQMRAQADEYKVLDAFAIFDADGDGFISPQELDQALRSVGMTVTDEIREILTALDADGDGRISFQEFNDFWNQNVREGHDVEGSAPKAWVSAGESLDALDFDTTKMLDELVPLHTVSVSTSLRRG